jgi:hypothetical protein
VELHWNSTGSDRSSAGQATAVRLEAGLAGPFRSVAELKAAAGSPSIVAPVVVATTASGVAPVSVIRIPPDASPGFYSLTTTVIHNGLRTSGGSVMQVEAG